MHACMCACMVCMYMNACVCNLHLLVYRAPVTFNDFENLELRNASEDEFERATVQLGLIGAYCGDPDIAGEGPLNDTGKGLCVCMYACIIMHVCLYV